jgi:DNA-binding transcriptional regulator YiaG
MIKPSEIKKARERLGETQEEFSRRFGVDQSTVHRWETYGVPDKGTSRMVVARVLTELTMTTF